MAVVSKIVHCYQLSSESGLQAGYSATGHSYLLATKLAYKKLEQLMNYSYLAILSLIPCVPSVNTMHMIKLQSVLI